MVRWFRDLEQRVDMRRLAGGTFLDIGAANGYAVKAAEVYGFRRAIGIEFDPWHARFGRERLKVEIVDAPVERVELPGDVTLIRMNHVLEHIEAPIELLRRCRAVLTDPGVLYVGVPNMASLSVRCWSAWHRYFLAAHVNYFDADSLTAAAHAGGFSRLRLWSEDLSVRALLKDPLAGTHIGKYYLHNYELPKAARQRLWMTRQVGKLYPASLDRALIRLFPLSGDTLVCLAQTGIGSQGRRGAGRS